MDEGEESMKRYLAVYRSSDDPNKPLLFTTAFCPQPLFEDVVFLVRDRGDEILKIVEFDEETFETRSLDYMEWVNQ